MCGQISHCGQIAEMMSDPRLAWVLIQEASLQQHAEELAEIAVHLYGQLGEAQAEISRLRVSLRAPSHDVHNVTVYRLDSPGVVGGAPAGAPRPPVGPLRTSSLEL